jgi:hypothetical protein
MKSVRSTMKEQTYEEIARELREAAETWGKQELQLSPKAAESLAMEANSDVFLLDIWATSVKPSEALAILETAATKLDARAKKGRTPDTLTQILTGNQDWGSVEVPPDLLRCMWEIGLTANAWLESHQQQEQVRFDKAMDAAVDAALRWVRLRKGIDGSSPMLQKTEVLTLEAQGKLMRLNAELTTSASGPVPF